MKVDLAKKQKLSNKEVIRELFAGKRKEEDLTALQQEYLEIIKTTYALRMEVRSKPYIVNALKEQYKISQHKAYRLINESDQVFGDVNHVNKKLYQIMAIEMALESYRIAKEKGNAMVMVQANKALQSAVGLDKDDADLPVFEKLQPNINVLVLSDGMEEKITKLLDKGVVNLNDFPTQEVEHEELDSKQHGSAD